MNTTLGASELFRNQCLNQHNYYRKLHGCPPLELDRRLCASANYWAKEISLKKMLLYSDCDNYGQNMYKSFNVNLSGRQPAIAWYRTCQYFNFHRPRNYTRAHNFIQMIWRETKRFGVGYLCRDGVVWVVAHYQPPMDPRFVKCNIPPRETSECTCSFIRFAEELKIEVMMLILVQILVEIGGLI